MDTLGTLFEQYGLLLVFAAVLVEQMGPPLPSGPLLMVAGALAGEARVAALSVAGVAWVAGMLGKVILYFVGGRYGRQAMGALCWLAVTPNSSIGKADRHFERWGAALLILAEFIPGVRTLAPSLAGAEKLSRPRSCFTAHSARRYGQHSIWVPGSCFAIRLVGFWLLSSSPARLRSRQLPP